MPCCLSGGSACDYRPELVIRLFFHLEVAVGRGGVGVSVEGCGV